MSANANPRFVFDLGKGWVRLPKDGGVKVRFRKGKAEVTVPVRLLEKHGCFAMMPTEVRA